MKMAQCKILDAQLYMYIPVQFHDCGSNTFRVKFDTRLHPECIILTFIEDHNSNFKGNGKKQNPRYTTTHDGQHICIVS
jgi:hypothetical protein